MAVYESTFSGLKLSTSAIDNFSLTRDDLRGYFSEADLKPLLNQNDCVGIRFYNLKDNGRIILYAASVNQDGFDLGYPSRNEFALRSRQVDNPVLDQGIGHPATDIKTSDVEGAAFLINRKHAAALGQGEEPFSSFFLKETLETLLKDPRFTGVCFYKVSMEAIPSTLLPMSIDPGGKFTHLAITSDINNNQIVGVDSSIAFDNVFSDRPCPGHCVNFDTSNNIIVSENPVVLAIDDFSGPYIPIWD